MQCRTMSRVGAMESSAVESETCAAASMSIAAQMRFLVFRATNRSCSYARHRDGIVIWACIERNRGDESTRAPW
jgi:hypothetical protein